MLQDDALQQIQSLVPLIDWNKALTVWSLFTDFPHSVTAPKPQLTATTTEECERVQSAEKLQLASEELNMVYSAPESRGVDCHSEQFCNDYGKDSRTQDSLQGIEAVSHDECCSIETSVDNDYGKESRMQDSLQGIEAVSHDECCSIETGVDMSSLKNDTQKCTDNSDRNTPVGCSDICDKTEEVGITAVKKSALAREKCLPSFRATCHRTGSQHCFQSPAAAAHFGGALQDYFGWNVDLSNYDIEAVLCIEDRDVRVGISLTNRSLHRRHITHFGKTTLRPTIAHGMLR